MFGGTGDMLANNFHSQKNCLSRGGGFILCLFETSTSILEEVLREGRKINIYSSLR